jgi:hypothetical protein
MIIETLIVCVTVFVLTAPMAYAKAFEIRERAHRLEADNDAADYMEFNRDIGGHE